MLNRRPLLESSIFSFGAGQVINRNEKLLLSDTTNDQTIQLSEIGDIQITEIARKEYYKMVLNLLDKIYHKK